MITNFHEMLSAPSSRLAEIYANVIYHVLESFSGNESIQERQRRSRAYIRSNKKKILLSVKNDALRGGAVISELLSIPNEEWPWRSGL